MHGKERFTARQHDLLPARLDVWQQALDVLDKTQLCETHMGLWLPKPEMLATPGNKFWLLVHVSNWVTARLSLFSKFGRQFLFELVSSTFWRTFLGRFPEMTENEKKANEEKQEATEVDKAAAKAMGAAGEQDAGQRAGESSRGGAADRSRWGSGGRKEGDDGRRATQIRHDKKAEICKYFTALLSRETQPFALRMDPIRSFTWRGWRVILDQEAARQRSELPLPVDIVLEMAWELSEVAFWVELCELNCRMVADESAAAFQQRNELLSRIFAGGHWSLPGLPSPREGLSALDIRDQSGSLEHFRVLLCHWEGCPRSLLTFQFNTNMPLDNLKRFESDATVFYCKTAYAKFGRAAAVP